MLIDCGSCAVAGLACDDCVVSVLLGVPEVPLRAPSGAESTDGASTDGAPAEERRAPLATDLPDDHAAAVAVLADSGLVPPLRLVTDGRAS